MLRTFTKALFGALFVLLAFSAPALAQDYSSQPAPQPAPAGVAPVALPGILPAPAPAAASGVAPIVISPGTVTNPASSTTTYGFGDELPADASSTSSSATPVKLAHTGGNYLLPVSFALVLLGFGGLLLTGFRQKD